MNRLPRSTLYTACVALLLAAHAWMALQSTIDLGVTADETAHVTSGYSYWHFNDYRLQPENGNLPQRWAALPLLGQNVRLEPSELSSAWGRSNVWRIGHEFFFSTGNNTEFMLLTARTMAVVWSIATGVLVFCWSRHLWGSAGGVLSLALFAISPTTLAHGPLVTSDMCAAFFLLASIGAWWRLTEKITWLRLGISMLALSLSAVSKFSFLLLGPAIFALIAWRTVDRKTLMLGSKAGLQKPWMKLSAMVILGLLHVVAAWVTIWAFFGFRFEAFSSALPPALSFYVPWEVVIPQQGFWAWFFEFAKTNRIFPEAYLQGFAFVLYAASERGAFIAGNYSTTGWWWFFPYAFVVKSTLAELVATVGLVAIGAACALRGSLRSSLISSPYTLPLLALGSVYTLASITSSLNIGHRHILPLYPTLFILAGAISRTSTGVRGYIAGGLIAIFGLIEAQSVRPHYLAFFNRLIGGPSEGWRHLVDSSLDWGQNLPRLASWLEDNRGLNEKTYLSMFGSDDPFYHGILAETLAPNYSLSRVRHWSELEPGLYCLSATMLQDVYSPFPGSWNGSYENTYQELFSRVTDDLKEGRIGTIIPNFGDGPQRPLWLLERARFARLCQYLRVKEPEATIGYSIFVYRLNAAEIATVVHGTVEELVQLMEIAIDAPD